MKRLLGLLLVMGMVGCGASEEGGGPSEEKSLAALGASAYKIKRNELGEVVEMQIHLFSSNEKLVYVKGLAKLETLSLRDCRNITDAGLVHLKGLTGLQTLGLGGTKITDAGLVHLKGMQLMQLLIPVGAQTDLGLKHYLAALETQPPRLWSRFRPADTVLLLLPGWRITDAGMVHLKGLTNLQSLDLRKTKITDAGLVHLKGLNKLQWLYLMGTKVTDAGVSDLKKSLPNCEISK